MRINTSESFFNGHPVKLYDPISNMIQDEI